MQSSLKPQSPFANASAYRCGVVLLCIAMAAGCRAGFDEGDRIGRFTKRTERVLHYNNFEEPEVVDPTLLTGHPDAFVAMQLFEALAELDPKTLEARPGVATHWQVDASGRKWTFHLRKDAKWSDGTKVTAGDFVSTWERALRPATAARYAYQLYPIKNARLYNTGRIARVLGDHTRPRRPPFVLLGPMRPGTTYANLATFPPNAHVQLVTSNLRRPAGDAEVPLRSSPADDAEIVSTLVPGAVGVVLSQKPVGEPPRPGARRPRDFVQVRPPEGGQPGWAREEALADAYPSLGTRHVEGLREYEDRAPLREGPTSKAPVVAYADDDDEAYVLEDLGAWSRVLHAPSKRSGYIATELLDNVAGDRHWFYVRLLNAEQPKALIPDDVPDDELGEAVGAPSRTARTKPPAHATEGWLPARALAADANVLGLTASDPHTLVVELEQPTPYLLSLTAFAAWRPVPMWIVERHGSAWTRPENIVTNGPFHLALHRPRDRIELTRSSTFHAADTVKLDRAVLYAVTDAHTSLNLFRAGYLDAIASNKIPVEVLPYVETKTDYKSGPYLATYFLRVNTDRPPLDDVRVRQALNLAIDKSVLCAKLLRGGRLPATHVVPPGIPGYKKIDGPGRDVEKARKLLADAGYPEGKGFPPVEYLFNTSEQHRLIGEFLQAQWKDALGIEVVLVNQEWKTYLGRLHQQDYAIARSGWIGDYLDPNSFLDLFVTGGGNNETGYDNPLYDGLIEQAASTVDPRARFETLARAEKMLAEELPVIPIYFYVNDFLVAPEVTGLSPNLLDLHPLRDVDISLTQVTGPSKRSASGVTR